MAINIKFDLAGNPEPPTILLANRSGNILGQLNVDVKSIDISDKLNDASEFSFTLYKYVDGKLNNLWDKVVDFKLVYCREWNEWFEIKVELDEATETIKTVFCTQLEKAELSQLNLYGVEINTEKDIEREDYKICILYDKDDHDASLLHRLLKDKAPHYSINKVDSTIANIQRTFSFDGTTIDDAFQEIAEEIGCLFMYHSYLDDDRILRRTISVYDLRQNCNNCGHRGDFTDECPKCNKTDINYGYGNDTLIFVTADELASEGIQLTTDTDSVKNCFKLEAGDDLMTATVRNCNPNGSAYIWRFSEDTTKDMSEELRKKIDSYNTQYANYYNDYESKLNESLVTKYNALITKYSKYKSDLKSISATIKGYSNLMNAYYDTIDLALYLKSSLMPDVNMDDTDAKKQAALLTVSNISPVAVNVDKIDSVSLATANSAVLSMAKIIVRSTYKVEINTSSISSDKKTWTGNFIVTNYSDEEDTATSSTISVTINNDTETFIKQKVDKALNKEKTDDLSISGLFEKELNVTTSNGKKVFSGEFYNELKKYALNPLTSFYDACESCLDILIDQGAGNKTENPDIYKNLYLPYYNKSLAIAAEIKIREDEIAVIEGVWDTTDENNPKLKTKGLQQYIEKCRDTIQKALDFEGYLGEKLWIEFCSYRRDDTYSNNNYISDGLNNAELFEKALEFIEVAENEIYKSSELQYSISTTLNNLLAIDKFKPLVDSFQLGNWIRVQVNDEIFKLRLIEYGIDFGSFENISVEFSEVTKIKNGISDIESILSQASSMATSYDSTQRQAKQGDDAKGSIDQWIENGLNSALVRIKNNNNEEITISKNGLLGRSYDEFTGTYSPEQFRLTHNIMAYTTDNWETVSAALGKHDYKYYDDNKILRQGTDYGLTAKFVTAGYVNGSQIIGGEIYSSNYEQNKKGTYLNLVDGDFELANGKIIYDAKENKVTLSGVTIAWNNTNDVPMSSVSGLDAAIDDLDKAIEDAEKNANNYTDDAEKDAKDYADKQDASLSETLTDAYEEYTDSKVSELDTAVAKYLKVGNSTLIGSTYVISPYIGGGYLNITNTDNNSRVIIDPNNLTKNNFIFQIHNGSKVTLGVDKDGNAYFDGKITTEEGTIGAWDITDKALVYRNSSGDAKAFLSGKGSQNNSYTVGSHTGKDWSIWVNDKFGVRNNGTLYADGGEFTGKVTASSGEISGNLSVSGSLTHTRGNYTVTLRAVPSTTSNGVFFITDKSSGSNVYPFIVNGDGSFKATKATISGDSTFGGTLSAADGTFKGTLSAVNGSFTKLEAGDSSFTEKIVKINANGKGLVVIGDPDYTESSGNVWEDITIRPQGNSVGNIGTPNHLWDTIYAKTGSISQSDRNAKKDIVYMNDIQEQFFNSLKPATFKFIKNNSGRTHYGFISQDIEDSLINLGLTGLDFAGFCKDSYLNNDGDVETSYSLRYTEFIALNTYMIQKLQTENNELKERIDSLEEKLQQLL